ncbi:MAG: cytochrome d ubiquinol oxidase subunit II [Thermoguttaceae bacterium]
MSYEFLCLTWFGLLGVLLAGYAILDGFDLGVGMLHPLAKTDSERRIFMNSIGPLWDGNEVWLVTFGGALFAAFPNAYASAFSGFYIAFHLLLLALILRAVSMEFRSKHPGPGWRLFWDLCFLLGSTIAPLLYGVAIGNSLRGIPLEANQDCAGSFLDLLNPYSLGVGVMALSLFVMHGNIYLYLKTEGELQKKLHGWIWRHFFLFLAIYVVMTVWTMIEVPHALANFRHFPAAWVIVVLNVLAVANIPRAIYHNRPLYAFVSSSCTIAALVFLVGMALFPNLVTSSIDPAARSITIYQDASSMKTLQIMLIIAVIGMPFVLSYTVAIYWVFRGKVQLDSHSY